MMNPPFDLTPAATDASVVGQWSDVIPLANVPIHTHVLPTGKLLFWGRRNPPGTSAGDSTFASLNQHATTALLWDPAHPDGQGTPTSNQPTDGAGNPINIFCSGHTFLADGRLLVTGGHLFDSQGISSSCFYDPATDQWTAGPDMGTGRWYPTALTLPDGRSLVLGGSHATGTPGPPPNGNALTAVPQVMDHGTWQSATDFQGLPLYPRIHVAPNGFVFMSGPLAQSYYLQNFDPPNAGAWAPVTARSAGARDYAPSVMYGPGKVVFIGGGLEDATQAPGRQVETIDLTAPQPAWAKSNDLQFPRRQHNGTLLPDGTVLVTGGTRGNGFDNLDPGNPVHTAELWDPSTGNWTSMADEAVDRCYHSTAVLLPDGRVFSGGGGEYAPEVNVSNPPKDTHADCQLFSPPYLFKGERPTIVQAPARVHYGQAFDVETPSPDGISMVTWIRLPSVTHSFDQNQRINFLEFQAAGNKVTVTAPPNASVCPPGHYMLFLLNGKKVPSIASIVRITSAVSPQMAAAGAMAAMRPLGAPVAVKPLVERQLSPEAIDKVLRAKEARPPVAVGITPICPYGLSACWGGAYEALKHLRGARLVLPMPDAVDSLGFLYLKHDGLPDIEAWPGDFAQTAHAVHRFRGVEITIEGVVKDPGGDGLTMAGTGTRPSLRLAPVEQGDKIQWDLASSSPQALTASEEAAFSSLREQVQSAGGLLHASVTGPLQKGKEGYILKVRTILIR